MAGKSEQRNKIAEALMQLPEVKPWPSPPGEFGRRMDANLDWQRGYAAPVRGPYDVVDPVVQEQMTQAVDRNVTETELDRLLRARNGKN